MIIYLKMNLALNNLQRLICHKEQPTMILFLLVQKILNISKKKKKIEIFKK